MVIRRIKRIKPPKGWRIKEKREVKRKGEGKGSEEEGRRKKEVKKKEEGRGKDLYRVSLKV